MSAAAEAVPNGTSLPPALAAIKPVQLSFPLPRTSNTRINIHLTIQSTALVLFVTTTSPEHDAGATAPMGSFVYAMPQNVNLLTQFPRKQHRATALSDTKPLDIPHALQLVRNFTTHKHAALRANPHARPRDAPGAHPGTEERPPDVRRQLDLVCECGVGWQRRGGDGGTGARC